MITHIDMDAFYAAVEVRDNPALAGKPVIVGGSAEQRGVVSTASYEARKFGVHSAMPSATARRLCPQGIFLPVRMDHYAQVSRQIQEIFQRYTPLVEPLSLDEAFLDVTGSEGLFGSTPEIARKIKADILREVRLVASVGVAPCKFVAKIASDYGKPDGFVVVEEGKVQEFLDPLPVGRIWGVGKVAGKEFQALGIETIGQLRQMPLVEVEKHFGKWGEHFWKLAQGIDDRQVIPDREAKSISHETTFATDLGDMDVLRAVLLELTEQVARRLRRHGLQGRTVNLKVRYADFSTITRSKTLPEPTDITQELWQAASEMLATKLPKRKLSVRLLGMGVSGFDQPGERQASLFDDDQQMKQRQLDTVADAIKAKFGTGAIGRAANLDRGMK